MDALLPWLDTPPLAVRLLALATLLIAALMALAGLAALLESRNVLGRLFERFSRPDPDLSLLEGIRYVVSPGFVRVPTDAAGVVRWISSAEIAAQHGVDLRHCLTMHRSELEYVADEYPDEVSSVFRAPPPFDHLPVLLPVLPAPRETDAPSQPERLT